MKTSICLLVALSIAACSKSGSTPPTSGCLIAGTTYTNGQVNPANPCETCTAGTSATAWSPAANGSACGLDQICEQGQCSTGCLIGGSYFAATATNPANSCEVCDPVTSTAAWTGVTGVAPADGSCAAGQVCAAGACTAACFISGTLVLPGASQPGASCLTCQPSAGTTSWSPVSGPAPEGGSCTAGEVCDNGNCEPGCVIDGGFFIPGASSPASACQTCQPALDTAAFKPASGPAPDGGCATGEVCESGSCTAGCSIGGTFVASGAPLPGVACLQCQPGSSTSSYTPVTGVAPDGGCAAGEVCNAGACAFGCVIEGAFAAIGEADPEHACRSCEPSVSTQVWVNDFKPWSTTVAGADTLLVTDLADDRTSDLVVGASGAFVPFVNAGNAAFDMGAPVDATVNVQSPGVALPYSNPPFSDVFFVGSNPAGAGQVIQYAKNQGDGGLAGCGQSGEAVPCVLSTGTDSIVAIAGGTFAAGDAGPGLAAVDLADSRVDYLLTMSSPLADVAFPETPPTPTSTLLGAAFIASGDFNGDGRDDLLVGLVWVPYQTQILIFLAQPGGSFASPVGVVNQPNPMGGLALADFNGDGNLGFAFTDQYGSVWIANGDGSGGFAAPLAIAVPGATNGLVAGDFNGDGLPDLAVNAYGPDTLSILYNQGQETFTSPVILYLTSGDPTTLSASTWSPPVSPSTYGSPTQLLGGLDSNGNVVALVNSCQ